MERNNSTCAVCGKDYYLCISCKEKINAEPWKVLTDTSEHYKVFQIVRAYNSGIYSIEEAYEKLKNVDLTDKEIYVDNVKKVVDKILGCKIVTQQPFKVDETDISTASAEKYTKKNVKQNKNSK